MPLVKNLNKFKINNQKLENTKNCGSQGYPIGYGNKYYMKLGENSFNEARQQWVNSVRKCLMHYLIENEKNLQNLAFSTHVGCYLKPGYDSKEICQIIKENENFFVSGMILI